MQCPQCHCPDTRVVDSRPVEEGVAIRRRRECGGCGSRFTTFERLEETPLLVRKRSGERVAFDGRKIVAGVSAACKGRPVEVSVISSIAAEVEEALRIGRHEWSTEEVGRAVLDRLRRTDHVAYLRFASVYKGFDNAEDFARELRLLEAIDPAAV